MLLFIYCRTSLLGNIKSFQYISCYSLSEQGERTASVRCRFNTSHVTLYHNRESWWKSWRLFQYISCYSLSRKSRHKGGTTLMFQYISCYSLSTNSRIGNGRNRSFNTSHVTLYRFFGTEPYQLLDRFNTSHVTLYLSSAVCSASRIWVSIHLMLLFIGIRSLFALVNKRFNTSHVTLYRIWSAQRRCAAEVSIHLMLLFIKDIQNRSGQATLVSIHLMLLFIGEEIPYSKFTVKFQYISCYSLSWWNTSIVCRSVMFQYISCYSLSCN